MGLDIELQDSNKNVVMKTVAENKRVHIIVLFGEITSTDVLLSSTSYYIRDVKTFMKQSYMLQTGRVPWDEAIQRTFGSLGRELLEARWSFGALIGSAAQIFAAVAHNDKSVMSLLKSDLQDHMTPNEARSFGIYETWIGYNAESFGREFVNFAIEKLDELKDLRDKIEPCLGYSVHEAFAEYETASLKLKQICSCNTCRHGEIRTAKEGPNCIYRLGEFIVILVWQLSVVDVSATIQPTQQGLEMLYDAWCSSPPDAESQHVGSIAALLSHLNASTAYQAARCLFAGHDDEALIRRSNMKSILDSSQRFPAEVSQGLCLFVDTFVEISDRPETRTFLHILPGTIEGPSGTHFDYIEDGDPMDEYQEDELKPLQDYTTLEAGSQTPLESKLLAQERLRTISASIQISGPKGSICVGPMELQRAILRSVGLIKCPGRGCDLITVPGLSSNNIMVVNDGTITSKGRSLPRGTVILRKLAGNRLARCISVAMPSGPGINFAKGHHRDYLHPALLLRRDECIPCCIRAGLSSQSDFTYITL